jgi:hypothetical protein
MWDVRGAIGRGRYYERAQLDENGNPEPGVKILPGNVAMKIRKGDVLLVNYHMINSTEEPIDACFKLNLHGIRDDEVRHEAGMIFMYNTMVTVPPLGRSTARMACPVTKDVMVGSTFSHMHSRGDGYVANLLDRAPTEPGAVVLRELYAGPEWDDPPMRVPEEPLQLRAGQYIDFQCRYTNREARAVSQGFASTDEMCMFLGFYWPQDLAFENCENPARERNGMATAGIVYGDGKRTGSEFLDCFWDLPEPVFAGAFDDMARFETLSCFTSTCPKASAGLNPYVLCVLEGTAACTERCTGSSQPGCVQECLNQGRCQNEYQTLRAATCD